MKQGQAPSRPMADERGRKQRAMLRAMAGWLSNVADTNDMPYWLGKPLDEHVTDAKAHALAEWREYA